MKYIIVSFIFFINVETMAKQISDLNWEKRVVIISFENKKEKIFLSSQKFIQENRCAVDDRNVQFIFFEKFKNTEFEMPKFVSNEFGIWLIGYDGSIKDYSKDDKIFSRLFNLIDSMPIRQNEIKKDKC